MRRGPKAKPTVLHRLHGTLNATRHRDRYAEPTAPGALEDVEPPDDLSEEEIASWRYAIEHAPRGVLKSIDKAILTLWVKTEARYRRAEAAQAKINAKSPLPDVVRSPGGMLVQSPYVGMMNRTALIIVRLAEQLGFTPASRPHLIGEQPEAAEDENRWLQLMALARKPSNQA
jgi:P27 family predicted phage terminase small subunit